MPPPTDTPSKPAPIAHVSYTTTVRPAEDGAAPEGAWWRRRPTPTTVAIGTAASLALAILAGLLLSPSMRKAPAGAPPGLALVIDTPSSAAQTFTFEKVSGRYQPPSAAEVERAHGASERAFRVGGISELAREGLDCFRALEKQPGYALMDYCLAFDLYGAAKNAQLAAGASTSSTSWFGSMGARHLNVAQSLMGADGDADARLLDLRRLTGQGTTVSVLAAGGPAPRAALQVQTVSADAEPLPIPLAPQPPGPAPRRAGPQPAALVAEPEPVARASEPPQPPQPAQPPAPPSVPTPEPVALAAPPG